MNRLRQSGLTLIELLVVLLIVALGWFTLLPRLDPTESAFQDKPLAEVNDLLIRAGAAALSKGRFEELRIERQTASVVWGEERVRLPSALAECQINDRPCPASDAIFRVYAQGFMDRLTLVLFSGERWTSADLASRLVQSDPQGRY